jgi:hypothetical protein
MIAEEGYFSLKRCHISGEQANQESQIEQAESIETADAADAAQPAKPDQPAVDEHVAEIAGRLDEKNKRALQQIGALITECGLDQTLAWLEEALKIEAEGGMMINDGSRRRSPGGVFFAVAKTHLPEELKQKIFPPFTWADRKKRDKARKTRLKSNQPPTVGEMKALVGSARKEQGDASIVKVTLIGRPGKIEQRYKLIVTMMTDDHKNVSLAKVLPPLPQEPTSYAVFIAQKQWKKVETAINDPEDELIVEGYTAFHPELKQMAVYAQTVTTKGIERARRDEQRPASNSDSSSESNGAENDSSQPAAATDPNMSDEERLATLQSSAAELEAQLDTIKAEGKPGAFSVIRELQKVRAEIKALEG